MPEASLDRVLHNALRGPSAGFSQGQALLVLRGDEVTRFWAVRNADGEPMAGTDGVRVAPVVVVPLSRSGSTSTGTRSPTRAGPTGTRRADRCRSGTSTPDSPRC